MVAVRGEPQLTEVHEVVSRYCRRSRQPVDGELLGASLIELRHTIDLLELEFSQAAAEFALTNEHERQGSTTHVDWVRHHCKMGGHAASDRLRVGEMLDDLPQSAEAMAGGEIGFAHLSLIASTSHALKTSATATSEFSEDDLLSAARETSVGRFRHLCHHLRHAQDAEGFAGDEKAAHEARKLSLTTSAESDAVYVRGILDSIGGATLRAALEPLARKLGPDDDRAHDRRMGDAVVELAGFALDTGKIPDQASQRAHLQVTTTLETLLGMAGAPAAELEHSLPISARAVERLACDCTVTRVLLGADSMVIDVGRARRVVSGPTRKALNVRDGHCAWPGGCERKASWSAAHHIEHWTRGGATDLPNLALLCGAHHWMVHEGGWQLVRAGDGRLIAIRPPPIPGSLQSLVVRAGGRGPAGASRCPIRLGPASAAARR